MEIRISKKDLELIGHASLAGMLFSKGIPPGPVTFLFEQTSMDWKRRNNGPDVLVLNEHIPLSLLENLLVLQRAGYTVTIGSYTSDPS